MRTAKITLSPKEQELVNNADWILTKNLIINKVYELFGQVSINYVNTYQQFSEFEVAPMFAIPPKISKGEQYLQLPYVMLDFPRTFTDTDYFAIRSFFWWGNHCSIHLLLKGSYLQTYGPSIDRFMALSGKYTLETKDWYIGVGADPWQHHFETDNYLLLDNWKGKSVTNLPFLKLAKKIPLEQWDDIELFLTIHFNKMLAIMLEY
ncbi:MAG: hypothetical protein RL596_1256 [Bacteroidota bacterium]|jgi:hypothetical protein